VEGVRALLLKHVVVHRRAGTGDDLGDGVGEVSLAGEAHVPLDYGEPAVWAGHDQGARLGHDAGRRRQEQQLQRLRPSLGRQVHEGAVLDEGHAERGEDVAVPPDVAAEVPLDHLSIGDHRLG
jgi:hypothetical protein